MLSQLNNGFSLLQVLQHEEIFTSVELKLRMIRFLKVRIFQNCITIFALLL